MTNTLFLISQSPQRAVNLDSTLRLVLEGDTLAFIQDGVYFSFTEAAPQNLKDKLSELKEKGITFCFLEPDLKARGIDTDEKKVTYDGLLDLIEKHSNIFH